MTDQCETVLLATDACSQTALQKSFAAKETHQVPVPRKSID